VKRLDKRLALIRNGRNWYPALVRNAQTKEESFRVAAHGTRNSYESCAQLVDAVKAVLVHGKMMRFATEVGKATTLSRRSRGVSGYLLDASIATAVGVPASGK
jgi:hypothetical protein